MPGLGEGIRGAILADETIRQSTQAGVSFVENFCFEGHPAPTKEAVVYAISLPKLNLKGTLVSALGIYSDADAASDELVKALQKKVVAYGATARGVAE